MAGNIPRRPTAIFTYMRVGLANITGTFPDLTYVPSGDFDTLPMFGPVTDGEIDAPIDVLNQTAGGDPGHMEIFTRAGVWEVRASAYLDQADVFGDTRMGSLIGQYVEFICMLNVNFNVAKGVGKLQGRMTFPARAGENVMREVRITRWLPSTTGNIVLANMKTGVFNTGVGY